MKSCNNIIDSIRNGWNGIDYKKLELIHRVSGTLVDIMYDGKLVCKIDKKEIIDILSD